MKKTSFDSFEEENRRKKENKPTRFELQVMDSFGKHVPAAPAKSSRWLGKPLQKINKMIHDKLPDLDKFTEKALAPLTRLFQQSKPSEMVEKAIVAYRQAGYPVESSEDIAGLSLDDVEQVVGELCEHYRKVAMSEEIETSLTDPDAPSDMVALINLNHQAISELACYFGFDIDSHEERLFALTLLEYAATTDEGARYNVFKRLVKKVRCIAQKNEAGTMDKLTFIDVLSGMTKAVSIRLVKAKIGQALPINGAVIGTGFNAYFTSEVCDVATFFYKQKFLARKYGDLYLDQTSLDEMEDLE